MITYKNFWNTLERKGISQYKLIKHYGISSSQITRLKNNDNISTHTIDRLCRILHCEVSDIISYQSEEDSPVDF